MTGTQLGGCYPSIRLDTPPVSTVPAPASRTFPQVATRPCPSLSSPPQSLPLAVFLSDYARLLLRFADPRETEDHRHRSLLVRCHLKRNAVVLGKPSDESLHLGSVAWMEQSRMVARLAPALLHGWFIAEADRNAVVTVAEVVARR